MLKTVSSITNAIGALNYKGTWDANANSPALASSVGTKGDYYVVSTAGTTNLNGISNWGVGDWAAFNGSVWQRVEGGADLNGVNLSVSGTTTLSGLTASTALALDASKNAVSVTNTGTGNNVLATSPTLVTPNLGDASASSIATSGGTNNLTAGASTRFLLELTNTARNAGDEYAIRTYLGSNNFSAGYHLYSFVDSVLKAFINAEGTFGSATNTYGSTSDLKLKQDIVDAGSQWNDVKSLKFKKYRYKSNPNGQLQLGVIAQDLEESSPGLVYETRDEDTEGNDLGTVTKNVKYSILYLKAVAALQEAIDRIEKLEADVAALKG
jgi:hypothetical protein